jgi:NADPH:quinone reductase-like Zn-dependent oxidoreductase
VEVPVPKPKKDEVLVKVEACSINPIDWKVQKGFMKPVLPYRFPHIPGTNLVYSCSVYPPDTKLSESE